MSTIRFKCPRCGGETFKVPRKDLQSHDRITCDGCGYSDTYERVVGPQAKKIAEDAVRKAFKGLR
jgi:transposase-like protein